MNKTNLPNSLFQYNAAINQLSGHGNINAAYIQYKNWFTTETKWQNQHADNFIYKSHTTVQLTRACLFSFNFKNEFTKKYGSITQVWMEKMCQHALSSQQKQWRDSEGLAVCLMTLCLMNSYITNTILTM